jgi:UDP-2,3-diacylglucosamine pyrophosphatase LpxH
MPAEILGQPCWYRDNVDQAIKVAARTDAEGVDYFLASHAPVNNIRHDETEELFNEETLFYSIFNSKGEVLTLIHGDTGAGKSHLIHWLKLRTEDALRQKAIKNIVPILIQRRTGSLKDALEQMVEQLGDDFKDYTSSVRTALSKISSDTAREKLVSNIGIELSAQQRIDKNREPLPKKLKNLAEFCSGSQGYRKWLCREDGVISKVVKHLTENHLSENGDIEVEGRLPLFTTNEFFPDDIYKGRRENTQVVLDLIDELDFEPELLEQATQFFNEVLPDAIKEMTGLSGTSLRNIFDHIRVDLKKRGESLALFIEDVSVMASLNEEVFTAVEPQPSRKDLCRMIAVIGSTNEGWNRLADNQRQRITHPISLGEQTGVVWQNDVNAVATFSARYLNTVRLTQEQIGAVASHRRASGGDVNISACDICPVRDECHAKFGKTSVGTVEVGLFPFTTIAPQQLLNNLSDKSAAHKNARGLLTRILQPALDSGFESLQANRFPNVNKFATSMYPLPYWAGFKLKYCGGWSETDINRLEFLAQGWVIAEGADDLAVELSPLLKPFGFREFSRGSVKPVAHPVGPGPRPKPVAPLPLPVNTRLNKILQSVNNWLNGEKLIEDIEIRKLVAEFVRNSIIWEDTTSPPPEVWKNLLGGANDYAFVRIEDQFHSPQTTPVFIDFPRGKETRDLIESLAQFRYAGNRSWEFEYGEYHKRIAAQWLRHHQEGVIEKLQPPAELDLNAPLAAAVQILSTAAIVRQRTKLPVELPELLKAVLADNWSEESFALSSEWKSLLGDMRIIHKNVLRFITNELNVPQGRSGGINFINAVPAINAALDFANNARIEIPGEEYLQSYWKSRFGIFQNKGRYNNFAEALAAEREAIAEVVNNISFNLRSVEYETDNLPEALSEFCSDLNELVKAQTDAKMPYPYQPFEELKAKKVFSEKKDVWRTAVKTAQEVISSNEIMSVLRFSPQNLKEAETAIDTATKYISLVEKDVAFHQERFEKEGDPDELTANLLSSLEKIEAMRS